MTHGLGSPMLLEARGVHHAYGAHRVLDGVDVGVHRGEMLGLIGPNGSGKTTLLRLLTAALAPDRGQILLEGRPLSTLRGRERARRLAVVAQEPAVELPQTVADLVLLGRTPYGPRFGRDLSESRRGRQVAAEALDRVGALHLAGREASDLSGGERQRVLIARALAQEPEVLLLDEPTNHLDVGYQHEVLRIVKELGLTTIVVLHDLNLSARYCDRVVLLHGGRVRADGSPDRALQSSELERVYGVLVEPGVADDGTPQFLFRSKETS